MICKIWNFLGSDLSRATKWRKWFETSCLGLLAKAERYEESNTHLSMLSSGLPFFR